MSEATFEHASTEGWATYLPLTLRQRICGHFGHRLPGTPETPNGYSPSCYARCARCRAAHKWFVKGQHRYGGFDMATFR